MMPTFSIIIPVYNVASYLHECLDSVLAQTFTNWECLCVDDGSTDGSGDILDEYAGKDKRFRVFHKGNGGVSSARNLALDNANGEWVWCIDGDDAIHPKALAHIFAVVSSNDVDAYAYRGAIYGETMGDNFKWPQIEGQQATVVEHKDISAYLCFKTATWQTFHRRARFATLRYQPYSRGEDVLFNVSLFWSSDVVAIDDATLYFYRQRRDSATSRHLTAEGESDAMRTTKFVIELERNHPDVFLKATNFRNWRRRVVIAGNEDRYLRMPDGERAKTIQSWLELQKSAIRAGYAYRHHRFAVALCALFPYGWMMGACIRLVIHCGDKSLPHAAAAFVAHRLGFRRRLKK